MTASSNRTTTSGDGHGSHGTHAADTAAFDAPGALDDLLSAVGLTQTRIGGSVSFAGRDPIVPAAHRLGACIGIPLMANAVAATAFHRCRGGSAQDLSLDLRQAVHTINPGAFWHPTLNGEPAPHPLVLDNPFSLLPYRAGDGRWIMASGVYPHQVAKWCRFLDVPPDTVRVATAIASWDAFELEEAANASKLPACVVRTPDEWLAHEQGALLASQPVVGIERIGEREHHAVLLSLSRMCAYLPDTCHQQAQHPHNNRNNQNGQQLRRGFAQHRSSLSCLLPGTAPPLHGR